MTDHHDEEAVKAISDLLATKLDCNQPDPEPGRALDVLGAACPADQLPALMTIQEAALWLRESSDVLRKRAKADEVPFAFKKHGRWLVDRDEMLHELERQRARRSAS